MHLCNHVRSLTVMIMFLFIFFYAFLFLFICIYFTYATIFLFIDFLYFLPISYKMHGIRILEVLII